MSKIIVLAFERLPTIIREIELPNSLKNDDNLILASFDPLSINDDTTQKSFHELNEQVSKKTRQNYRDISVYYHVDHFLILQREKISPYELSSMQLLCFLMHNIGCLFPNSNIEFFVNHNTHLQTLLEENDFLIPKETTVLFTGSRSLQPIYGKCERKAFMLQAIKETNIQSKHAYHKKNNALIKKIFEQIYRLEPKLFFPGNLGNQAGFYGKYAKLSNTNIEELGRCYQALFTYANSITLIKVILQLAFRINKILKNKKEEIDKIKKNDNLIKEQMNLHALIRYFTATMTFTAKLITDYLKITSSSVTNLNQFNERIDALLTPVTDLLTQREALTNSNADESSNPELFTGHESELLDQILKMTLAVLPLELVPNDLMQCLHSTKSFSI